MPAAYASFFALCLILIVSTPAFAAGTPPMSAPLTPVDVAPLPPVQAPAAATAPAVVPPASAAVETTPEPAWWRQPFVYALIALAGTLAAFGATVLYMRKPEPGTLRVAVSMTGASAVFILAALVAWVL